jgi:transposase
MRFVPIKNIEQQETLSMHRARSLAIKERTALTNQIRGLLMEFGIIVTQGIRHLRKQLPWILEDAENELTPSLRELFQGLYNRLLSVDKTIEQYDDKILLLAKNNKDCQRLMKVEGVGALSATAIVASVGNAKDFKNGREMAAWLGLVPKQQSSGNKIVLLGISKRGDRYLRELLIHGGRAVVRTCNGKEDARHQWVKKRKETVGYNRAAVALANKDARIIWALLAKNEEYQKAA